MGVLERKPPLLPGARFVSCPAVSRRCHNSRAQPPGKHGRYLNFSHIASASAALSQQLVMESMFSWVQPSD